MESKLARCVPMRDGHLPEFGLYVGEKLIDRYARPERCAEDADNLNTWAASLVAEAVKREREECAKVLEWAEKEIEAIDFELQSIPGALQALDKCKRLIRARSEGWKL